MLIVIGYLLWEDASDTEPLDEYDDDLSEEDDASYAAPLAISDTSDTAAGD